MALLKGQTDRIDKKIAFKYVEECRKQANRDLESARVLLASPDTHLENVAFLLEQAYEKILKAAYMNYKTQTSTDSLETFYEKARGHNIKFMISMLREITEGYADFIIQFKPKVEPIIKERGGVSGDKLLKMVDTPDKLKQTIMDKMNNVGSRIDSWNKKTQFTHLVSKLSSDKIDTHTDISEHVGILDSLGGVVLEPTDLTAHKRGIQQYTVFMETLLNLAQYTLLHAVMSRYPDKCGCVPQGYIPKNV